MLLSVELLVELLSVGDGADGFIADGFADGFAEGLIADGFADGLADGFIADGFWSFPCTPPSLLSVVGAEPGAVEYPSWSLAAVVVFIEFMVCCWGAAGAGCCTSIGTSPAGVAFSAVGAIGAAVGCAGSAAGAAFALAGFAGAAFAGAAVEFSGETAGCVSMAVVGVVVVVLVLSVAAGLFSSPREQAVIPITSDPTRAAMRRCFDIINSSLFN